MAHGVGASRSWIAKAVGNVLENHKALFCKLFRRAEKFDCHSFTPSPGAVFSPRRGGRQPSAVLASTHSAREFCYQKMPPFEPSGLAMSIVDLIVTHCGRYYSVCQNATWPGGHAPSGTRFSRGLDQPLHQRAAIGRVQHGVRRSRSSDAHNAAVRKVRIPSGRRPDGILTFRLTQEGVPICGTCARESPIPRASDVARGMLCFAP